MICANYDLSKCPASFNFIEFLVSATTYGVEHIYLSHSDESTKFNGKELKRRIDSILIPACEIAGVTWEMGAGKGLEVGYHMSSVLKAYEEKGFIKKLVSKKKGSEKYTVTIRNYNRMEGRNSVPAWRDFAQDIGALVIEDYYDKPIDLKERFALYAGAEMNYFVANGPLAMCLFSDYPYTAYIPVSDPKWANYHKEHGWYLKQLPWANEKQTIEWARWKATSPTC